MKYRITCPACQRTLVLTEALLGKKVRCPNCKKSILVPKQHADKPDQTEHARRPVPPQAQTKQNKPRVTNADQSPLASTAASQSPEDAARNISVPETGKHETSSEDGTIIDGIDTVERLQESFATRKEAEQEIDRLGKLLPSVSEAYRPSGKTSAIAIGWLAIGMQVGVLGGIVGVLIGCLISSVVAILLLIVTQMIPFLKDYLTASFFTCFTCGVVFMALGWVCGGAVGWFSTYGRNQNTKAAVCFSSASALLCCLVLGPCLSLIPGFTSLAYSIDGTPLIQGVVRAPLVILDQDIIGYSGLIIAFSSLLLAAVAAIVVVRSRKFCEQCEVPMNEESLKGMWLGQARIFAKHIEKGELTSGSEILKNARGGDCCPVLASCPVCGAGYLDVTVVLNAKWKGKEDTDTPVIGQWRLVSKQLTLEELAVFRPSPGDEQKDTETDSRPPKAPWIPLVVSLPAFVAFLAIAFLFHNSPPERANLPTSSARPSAGTAPQLSAEAAAGMQKDFTSSPENWEAFQDMNARFQCQVPPGWTTNQNGETERSNVVFSRGTSEIRVITRPTERHVLDESDRSEIVAIFGNILNKVRKQGGQGTLQDVSLTRINVRDVIQSRMEIVRPIYNFMRQVKFKEDGWDHTLGLYVDERNDVQDMEQVFDHFVEQYVSLPGPTEKTETP